MAREHVHVDILLKPFKFWCQKVLPLVYDDSLSYYEVLCKLTKYINELIENMRTISDAFDVIQDEFDDIQEEFDEIKTFFDSISELVEGFNTRLTQLETEFEEEHQYVSDNFEQIFSDITDIRVLDITPIRTSITEITNELSEFEEWARLVINQNVENIAWLANRLDNLPQLNIDDALSSTSENPVQNKVITAALQGITPATIDTDLSTTSTNPVQNKVIGLKFADVDADISSLETAVQTVENNVTNINNSLSTLSTAVNQHSTDISGINTSIANLQANYINLASQMQTANSKLELLETASILLGKSTDITLQNGSHSGTFTITYPKASLPSDFMINGGFNGAKYYFMCYPIFGWTGIPLTVTNFDVSSSPIIGSDVNNYIFTFNYAYNISGVTGTRTLRVSAYYAQHN